MAFVLRKHPWKRVQIVFDSYGRNSVGKNMARGHRNMAKPSYPHRWTMKSILKYSFNGLTSANCSSTCFIPSPFRFFHFTSLLYLFSLVFISLGSHTLRFLAVIENGNTRLFYSIDFCIAWSLWLRKIKKKIVIFCVTGCVCLASLRVRNSIFVVFESTREKEMKWNWKESMRGSEMECGGCHIQDK